jgi:hypothetical protein
VQRPLCERGEGTDRLDLVAEELDPQRLAPGRRVDVDETAAQREVAALLDPVDPLVAGERELLGECLDARLVAGAQAERLRPGLLRGHALRERGRRRDHEAAARQDVEGPVPLADQVRRRLETRFPAHAPAREEADVLRPDEPACRLREVAGVAVLGDEHDQAATEPLTECGDDERQCRVGHPGALGQGVREELEPLAVGQLPDERVQNGLVHDDRRNRSDPPQPCY